MKRGMILSGVLFGSLATLALADVPAAVTVHVDQPGIKISPTLYGLMTEEINHSYDGGLYAELIRNRTFQDDAKQPDHWTLVQPDGGSATMSMTRDDPVNAALPVSLQLKLPGGDSEAGVANDGFWGIAVRPETRYTASFYAKGTDGFTGALTASLQSADGKETFAKAHTQAITGAWTKQTLILTTGQLEATAQTRFVISAHGHGTVSLSLVSLFPPTYNNRPNGNRIDLMKKMADMNQSFLRLPGGNYVEGMNFKTRYNWKEMIGPIDKRPGHQGCWGYRSSDGEGLLEMLDWCEDLHIEPLLAVFAGYTLNRDYVPAGEKLKPYVDEALQEIEYCTGDITTEWGKKRAADGHPEPFKIRYVEIGNEDQFDRSRSYEGRFAQFYDAIKAKYPDLQLIATTHVKSRRPDLFDDHYYRSAHDMAFDDHHYDKTDRHGPKIFVGEWASTEGRPTPNLKAALGDAAWLMGLERNSDIVTISCYAPLLVNVNIKASQWGTNLIGYDAMSSYGSPSYYVQSLFAHNAGNNVLPTELDTPKLSMANEPKPHGQAGVGTWDTQAEYKDLTVTVDGKTITPELSPGHEAWKTSRGTWKVQDGALVETGSAQPATAVVGDPQWTDYTVSVKARKTAGREGFLVLVRSQDAQNYLWWNVGGWGNTQTAVEGSYDGTRKIIGQAVPMQVKTGQWYDLRVEVKGRHIQTFLDGKPVNELTEQPFNSRRAIFASATKINASNEVIIKLVNMTSDAADASINLQGIGALLPGGRVTTISSADPADQNSIAEPTKIAPHEEPLDVTTPKFDRALPPWSLTLMRLKVAP